MFHYLFAHLDFLILKNTLLFLKKLGNYGHRKQEKYYNIYNKNLDTSQSNAKKLGAIVNLVQ